MLIISLGSIAILMYFVGYYLTKIKWIGIICGGVMAVASIGAMFQFQHWEGANEMLIIGISSSLVLVPIVVWKRKAFHFLMIRFCIATVLICLYYSPVFFNNARVGVMLAYDHESIDIKNVLEVVDANRSERFLGEGNKAVERGIEKSYDYINKYGTEFGFTLAYRLMTLEYQLFAEEVIRKNSNPQKLDSLQLTFALKAVRQEYKIAKLFDFEPSLNYTLESEILLAMGKRQEAIQALENLEKLIPAQYVDDRTAIREK
jgi:hypothetical protein